MLKSFDYIINDKTRLMVIGTMPGVASLTAVEYYAHPRNAFWKIISDIFNGGHAFKTYQEKLACLLSHEIGLWDNLQYCEREGSLDSNIQHEFPNDFETLLKQNPQIKCLLFNGQKSFAFFKKYHENLLRQIEWHLMPSTSPANARLTYGDKLKVWKSVLK